VRRNLPMVLMLSKILLHFGIFPFSLITSASADTQCQSQFPNTNWRLNISGCHVRKIYSDSPEVPVGLNFITAIPHRLQPQQAASSKHPHYWTLYPTHLLFLSFLFGRQSLGAEFAVGRLSCAQRPLLPAPSGEDKQNRLFEFQHTGNLCAMIVVCIWKN
jgi:hypothetical protein